MNLSLIRHLWGVDHTHGLDHYLPRWREVGYTAVESAIRLSPDREALLGFLKTSGMKLVPQVSDPRAPEWDLHLTTHERWWDIIWDSQKRRGIETSYLTPEFGPPPYMPTLPHTGVPVADLADICDWMARREESRFSKRA